jgi:Ca-activated chloride channel family protein
MIDNLPDDRIGLVVFAGNAYAQMPLSFDKEAARMYTLTADPKNIAAQGTSVGDAFEKAGFLFGDESERFRSVVLITDGETHDENAIEKAKEMAEKGIMINTIGIGSVEGATILDSSGNQKRDVAGQIVISKLNENFLKELARMTNGVYVHLQNTEAAINEVSAQFSQIEKKALGDTSLFNYNSYYAWLGLPMLFLIIAEVFMPDRKRIKP